MRSSGPGRIPRSKGVFTSQSLSCAARSKCQPRELAFVAKIKGVNSPREVGSRRRAVPRAEQTPIDPNSTLEHLGKNAATSAQKPRAKSTGAIKPKPRRAQGSKQSGAESLQPGSHVWTVPNVLSFSRIFLVPLFLWLVLVPEYDGLAILVLVVSGLTDYLDGKIARATGQITNLGVLLDPIADRLFILAVVFGLGFREIIPWWLALSLPLRDILLLLVVPFIRTRGYSSLPVHFLGKAATAVLLYAFPLLLLGDGVGPLANLARVFGWAFSIWGVALYWWAGLLYVVQVRRVLVTMPKRRG